MSYSVRLLLLSSICPLVLFTAMFLFGFLSVWLYLLVFFFTLCICCCLLAFSLAHKQRPATPSVTPKTDIPSSSSPPSSSSRKITYDVFLSFRGTDTRQNFTDHLYTALIQKGIVTFRDDEELERGESIAPSLLKAIEESRYVVVVFSRHYADSSWCLDEIAKVAECMKQMGQKVLPVFYDVDPSDVRRQKGDYFEKAFSEHHKRYKGDPGKVQRWRDALLLIGNLSGWHLQKGPEAKVIQEVVQKIFTELNQIISTSEGLVGMDSQLEEVLSYLDIGCPDVRIVGIRGMGGIGKTTLAQVVFDRVKAHFESYSFLENVRAQTAKQGTIHLQKQLLLNTLDANVNVQNEKDGRDIIKHRLGSKRVLIVLDDVDQEEQFKSLCDRTWFGPGSRIIITSRDEHILNVSGADQIYEVNLLSATEALQLFSLKASKGGQLVGDFLKLSEEYIKYADGLPLAIIVLGSSLHGRSVELWFSALDRLKKSPEKKIMNVLRWSFDGLEESEQRIFLDIACFFKGKSRDRVRRILQGSNAHCPDFDLQVLFDKSMTTLSGEKLWMHDMIQEMGRAVVCEETEPGRRSRLWRFNEIIRILDRSKATSVVQSISLIGPTEDEMVHSLNDSFSDMDNLRLLKICSVKFSGNIEYLSNELQYLKWRECPLNSFPSDFHPKILVELKLHSSCIQQLWKGENGWSMLRFIDLRCSKFLRSTPDFTKVPHLEKLNLLDCTSLANVHPSLGCLKKLDVLDMTNCESVESLPPFTNLESLRYLSLAHCSRLKKFPEIEGDMKALLYLCFARSSIDELPTSVACLTGLTFLDLCCCKNLMRLPSAIRCLTSMKGLSLAGCANINELPEGMDIKNTLVISGTAIRDLLFVASMKSLKFLHCQGCKGLASESGKGLRPLWSLTCLIGLDLSDCSLMDGAIPDDLRSLVSLTDFNLSGNNFVRLPDSISQLSKLEDLDLSNCTQLQLVPKLPSSVQYVNARDCNSLKDFPNQIKRLSEYTILNSLNSDDSSLGKTHIETRTSPPSDVMHWLAKGEILGDAQMERKLQVADDLAFKKESELLSSTQRRIHRLYPDDELPEWFSTRSQGNRISIPIPPNLIYDDKWHGVAMCAVFSQKIRNKSDISLVDPGSQVSQHVFQCTLAIDHFQVRPGYIDWDEEQTRTYSHLLSVFYIPKSEIPNIRMLSSITMSATFETSPPSSWHMQICGIHLVYEQDAGWCDKLFSLQEQSIFLIEVISATQNSGWISRVDTFWKWEPCTPSNKEDSTTILQKKNIVSVLPRWLQVEHHSVRFSFNLSGCPGWCSDSSSSIELPLDLQKCKKWVGIVAYASIAKKEPYELWLIMGDSCINLSNTSAKEPHHLVFVYIPRAVILQEFTKTSNTVLTMAFSIPSPEVEVQGIGFKIVDRQEGLEEFVEAIVQCMQRADTLERYENLAVKKWIDLLRLKGDSCTPNKLYSRTRRERKFELLSQKYKKWDWSASGFYCAFLGDEFCRKKWFMHFNQGNCAEIQLPPNLLGDPNWLGIAVCAITWQSPEDQNIILDTPESDTYVLSWHLEFDTAWDRLCTYKTDHRVWKLRPQSVLDDRTCYMYVPRVHLKLRRQRHTAKVTFWSSSPCLRVRRCALRLVYKEDIEDIVQSLTLCELP